MAMSVFKRKLVIDDDGSFQKYSFQDIVLCMKSQSSGTISNVDKLLIIGSRELSAGQVQHVNNKRFYVYVWKGKHLKEQLKINERDKMVASSIKLLKQHLKGEMEDIIESDDDTGGIVMVSLFGTHSATYTKNNPSVDTFSCIGSMMGLYDDSKLMISHLAVSDDNFSIKKYGKGCDGASFRNRCIAKVLVGFCQSFMHALNSMFESVYVNVVDMSPSIWTQMGFGKVDELGMNALTQENSTFSRIILRKNEVVEGDSDMILMCRSTIISDYNLDFKLSANTMDYDGTSMLFLEPFIVYDEVEVDERSYNKLAYYIFSLDLKESEKMEKEYLQGDQNWLPKLILNNCRERKEYIIFSGKAVPETNEDLQLIRNEDQFIPEVVVDYILMALCLKHKEVYSFSTVFLHEWYKISYNVLIGREEQSPLCKYEIELLETQANNEEGTLLIPLYFNRHYHLVVRRWFKGNIFFFYVDSDKPTKYNYSKGRRDSIPEFILWLLYKTPLWPTGYGSPKVYWVNVPTVRQEENECATRCILHSFMLATYHCPHESLLLLHQIEDKFLPLSSLLRCWVDDMIHLKRFGTPDWLISLKKYDTEFQYTQTFAEQLCLQYDYSDEEYGRLTMRVRNFNAKKKMLSVPKEREATSEVEHDNTNVAINPICDEKDIVLENAATTMKISDAIPVANIGGGKHFTPLQEDDDEDLKENDEDSEDTSSDAIMAAKIRGKQFRNVSTGKQFIPPPDGKDDDEDSVESDEDSKETSGDAILMANIGGKLFRNVSTGKQLTPLPQENNDDVDSRESDEDSEETSSDTIPMANIAGKQLRNVSTGKQFAPPPEEKHDDEDSGESDEDSEETSSSSESSIALWTTAYITPAVEERECEENYEESMELSEDRIVHDELSMSNEKTITVSPVSTKLSRLCKISTGKKIVEVSKHLQGTDAVGELVDSDVEANFDEVEVRSKKTDIVPCIICERLIYNNKYNCVRCDGAIHTECGVLVANERNVAVTVCSKCGKGEKRFCYNRWYVQNQIKNGITVEVTKPVKNPFYYKEWCGKTKRFSTWLQTIIDVRSRVKDDGSRVYYGRNRRGDTNYIPEELMTNTLMIYFRRELDEIDKTSQESKLWHQLTWDSQQYIQKYALCFSKYKNYKRLQQCEDIEWAYIRYNTFNKYQPSMGEVQRYVEQKSRKESDKDYWISLRNADDSEIVDMVPEYYLKRWLRTCELQMGSERRNEFIQMLHKAKANANQWMQIDAGSYRNINLISLEMKENLPPSFRVQRYGENSCVINSLANALHYINDINACNAVVSKIASSLDYGEYGTYAKSRDAYAAYLMNFEVKGYKSYKKKNLDILKDRSMWPTLCILQGSDHSVNHAVTVVENYIFESNSQTALMLTKENLDWCCSSESVEGIKFDQVFVAYRFEKHTPPSPLLLRDFSLSLYGFNSIIQCMDEVEETYAVRELSYKRNNLSRMDDVIAEVRQFLNRRPLGYQPNHIKNLSDIMDQNEIYPKIVLLHATGTFHYGIVSMVNKKLFDGKSPDSLELTVANMYNAIDKDENHDETKHLEVIKGYVFTKYFGYNDGKVEHKRQKILKRPSTK